jgi:acetoin utilization protein AcuB
MAVLTEIGATYGVAIAPTATAGQALSDMRSHGVEALPVLDKGKLVGILTEGDLARAFYERIYHRSHDPTLMMKLLNTPIREFMSVHPVHVLVGMDAAEALALMRKKNIKHLPLLRADGAFLGIVERKTVLGLVLQ